MQLSGSRCSVSSLESAAESIARSMSPNRCAKIVLCEPNGTENFFSISLTTPQRSRKADGKPDFWISEGRTGEPVHVAFASASRSPVDAFHRAALAAGGRDNGAPGIRAEYHPTYYGAFVLDPDGNNVEAVCHIPED